MQKGNGLAAKSVGAREQRRGSFQVAQGEQTLL
jgi:hypothetical protein